MNSILVIDDLWEKEGVLRLGNRLIVKMLLLSVSLMYLAQ